MEVSDSNSCQNSESGPLSAESSTNSSNTELFFTWCSLWCCVWFGTTIGGSVFGFLATLLVILFQEPAQFYVSIFGLFAGASWAGVVGLFVIPSFALLMYICFCSRRPLVLASIAGALTGTVSMPPLFIFTAPIGAYGAYYFARWYLSTQESWLLRVKEQRRLDEQGQPFNFTIASLFGRTTAAAVLIAFWTFVIRALYSYMS
jgi:hypothetical protein